eukprot:UN21262
MMHSESWLGVLLHKSFIIMFNLTFFVHIFEGNQDFQN